VSQKLTGDIWGSPEKKNQGDFPCLPHPVIKGYPHDYGNPNLGEVKKYI